MFVAKPPPLDPVFRQVGATSLWELANAISDTSAVREYIHWDKLRHLTPPEGHTHEEWWFAIRDGRGPRELLPLLDTEGRPFEYRMPSNALRLLHYVDQHCSGEIAMREVVTTDEQARHHYLVNSLMEEAIRSSQLEGATTSRRVAKELLRTGRLPRDRSELMILNNYRALEFMREEMGATLTPELVIALQRILTEGALDDPTAAGRLQTPEEDRVVVYDRIDGSVLHTPPPAVQLPDRLRAMCDFANQQDSGSGSFLHPVVRGILLHFWLAYDHPFVDGNGRTARALFYWYMRMRGYWLVEYLSISRIFFEAPAQYTRSFLYTETDGGDTTYFLLHHLKVIKRAVEELHLYLQRKVNEIQEVERLIRAADELNHRQLSLLSDAIRHPDGVYTYSSHAASHKVTHETARADLMSLERRGLLQRRIIKRRHLFSPVPDLGRALQMF